jgi:hypothetical protein
VKILLGCLNAKLGTEDNSKPRIGNESLHEESNDNGVIVVNFATSKNELVTRMTFVHINIHIYTWAPPDGNVHNQIDHVYRR